MKKRKKIKVGKGQERIIYHTHALLDYFRKIVKEDEITLEQLISILLSLITTVAESSEQKTKVYGVFINSLMDVCGQNDEEKKKRFITTTVNKDGSLDIGVDRNRKDKLINVFEDKDE